MQTAIAYATAAWLDLESMVIASRFEQMRCYLSNSEENRCFLQFPISSQSLETLFQLLPEAPQLAFSKSPLEAQHVFMMFIKQQRTPAAFAPGYPAVSALDQVAR